MTKIKSKDKSKYIFNEDQFRARALADIDDFFEDRNLGELRKGKNGRHIFKDNGSNILFVAHLDTVNNSNHFYPVWMPNGYWIITQKCDDRLGAYIGLDWLQVFDDMKYDWLLTEGEERGNSTAKDFSPSKQYNWMFEFDRHGNDVVMYDYDCKSLRDLVKEAGGTPGNGSWSDIGDLQHLKCKGVNWGSAYYNEHDTWAMCAPNQTALLVNQFMNFYRANKDTYLPHEPKEKKWGRGSGTTYTYPTPNSPVVQTTLPTPNQYEKYKFNPRWRWCNGCRTSVSEDYFMDGKITSCIYCCSNTKPEQTNCVVCNKPFLANQLDNDGVCRNCDSDVITPADRLRLGLRNDGRGSEDSARNNTADSTTDVFM